MFTNVPVALCITPPVIYVANDGSGDFNCDGDNDQVEINQALKYVAENPGYTTVFLKGPFTYIIDDTLFVSSNTTVTGDPGAVIKLTGNAGWPSEKPLIKEASPNSINISICGFKIDGNREENTNIRSGRGYYNLIHFTDSQKINVYNMNLTNNHGDGLKTDNCSDIKFCNNNAYLLGHDALYTNFCSGVEACNNIITCRTNSGLRLYNTNHASFYNNNITSGGGGGAGIEIQKDGDEAAMDDIEVYNNIIHNTMLSGILVFGSGSYPPASTNVHIHHNQIFDTGTDSNSEVIGGILSEGFSGLIENNAIDGAYGAGIIQTRAYRSAPEGSGFLLTVRNNIITNTRASQAEGNGSGICNLLTDTHSFCLENNAFYNNIGGNYLGVEPSSSDINADPQYADRDNHSYFLKSKIGRWNGSCWTKDDITSPCIDAGYNLSDYSNEPEPNGNRINIGPDGNTWYASKSESEVLKNIRDKSGGSRKSSKSSGSKSGGGSMGGSPEPEKNIAAKELSQAYISAGKPVKFEFPKNTTAVVNLSFSSKKTVGKTTTIVEMLKNKSTLTPEAPEAEIYNYLNVWVGKAGYGTGNSIENPLICFKVEKAWVKDKDIDQTSIKLNRHGDSQWNKLPTTLLMTDENYLYFTSEAPGFSSFAITGKTIEKRIIEIPNKSSATNLIQNESTGSEVKKEPEEIKERNISQKKNIKMSGFEIPLSIICLITVFLKRRK